MVKAIIVEDQTILCESLSAAINTQPDFEVVATLSNASLALETALEKKADIILMDICTEHDSSGITATREIKKKAPRIKVVLMTGMPEISFVEQAKEAGADSFIYKNVGTDELITALRSTMFGYSLYPNKTPQEENIISSLTETELSILRLVCETKTRKEIAAELFMSEGTVKRHISEILAKTGYDSILRLAVTSVANGLIAPNLKNE
ncbi:MAG: response regulator [Anaerotardibacter sp.]